MDQLSDLPTAILLLSPGLGDMAAVCLLGNRRVLPDFSLPQALSRPAEPGVLVTLCGRSCRDEPGS